MSTKLTKEEAGKILRFPGADLEDMEERYRKLEPHKANMSREDREKFEELGDVIAILRKAAGEK